MHVIAQLYGVPHGILKKAFKTNVYPNNNKAKTKTFKNQYLGTWSNNDIALLIFNFHCFTFIFFEIIQQFFGSFILDIFEIWMNNYTFDIGLLGLGLFPLSVILNFVFGFRFKVVMRIFTGLPFVFFVLQSGTFANGVNLKPEGRVLMFKIIFENN
jgi:hypothetical protein